MLLVSASELQQTPPLPSEQKCTNLLWSTAMPLSTDNKNSMSLYNKLFFPPSVLLSWCWLSKSYRRENKARDFAVASGGGLHVGAPLCVLVDGRRQLVDE